jgi:hypothetical protein
MRANSIAVACLLAFASAGVLSGQITENPIPAPIEKRGLAVEIRDVVRLPDTRGLRPLDQDVSPAGWARPNYVRDLPTDGGSSTTRAAASISSIATSCRSTPTSRGVSPTRSTTGW